MERLKHFRSVFLRLVLLASTVSSLFIAGVGSAAADGGRGAVYTLTNAASGNAVMAYSRDENGKLSPAGEFATGGLGTGAGLGSQGALALSQNNRWLFAVNAGSDEISSFMVTRDGLELAGRVASGGDMPISLTVHGNLLYVLNTGGSGNITGFRIGRNGWLKMLSGSTLPLSNGGTGAAPGPAQVSFDEKGETLVVTEKATNLIDTYRVGDGGRAQGPEVHASAGTTPFGFDFGLQGTLVVSEAFGGTPAASALSSYMVSTDRFDLVTASAPTHQTAACWVVVTNDGRYAYTTNAGSSSISGYAVGRDGSLTLLNADGRTALTGGGNPQDMALNREGHTLYVLVSGVNQIQSFMVNGDGSLKGISNSGVPAGSVGLAAW